MTKTNRMLFAALLVLVMVFTAACTGKDANTPATTTSAATGNDTKPVPGFIGSVLYDQDGIKVTVTDYVTDHFYGPELYVTVTNSTDKDVLFKSELLSVNGYMMNNALASGEVAAGAEEALCFVFSNEEMARCGIEALSRLEFYITICDCASGEALTTPKLVALHLTEECNMNVDASGEVVYDKDGIRIIFKGVKEDLMYQGAVYFFVENQSGRNISIFNKEISLNGVSCADFFRIDVRHDLYALDCIYLWDLSSYNLESLDQIDTIALNLQVVEYETEEVIDTVAVNINN